MAVALDTASHAHAQGKYYFSLSWGSEEGNARAIVWGECEDGKRRGGALSETQKAGRAGRTCDGVVTYLYDVDDTAAALEALKQSKK